MSEVNWGSVADWAAAAGSLFASVTALWLAKESTRVRIKGHFGIRVTVGNGEIGPELAWLSVTNTGTRPVKITTIAIRTGVPFNRRHAIVPTWESPFSSQLPVTLNDGESASWAIVLKDNNKWIRDLCSGFILSKWDVKTFRVLILASAGSELRIVPETSLLERMQAAVKANAASPHTTSGPDP